MLSHSCVELVRAPRFEREICWFLRLYRLLGDTLQPTALPDLATLGWCRRLDSNQRTLLYERSGLVTVLHRHCHSKWFLVDIVGVEPTPTVLETAVLAVTPYAHMWSHRRDALSPIVCDSEWYIDVLVFISSLTSLFRLP